MAKPNNSGRTKKSYNYKPYDTSNSFVKRITAKVSEILPQSSSWISNLFSPAPKLNVREREELEEEDEEEEERQPPTKRLCFGPPEASDYSHQNNVNRLSDIDRESGEISPILNSRLDDDRAVPGPSGLHLRNFVSSTPAVRQASVESSPKVIPGLVKRTSVSEVKKNATNKRSSLNLSSTSTLYSPSQPSFDTFVFRNPLNKSGLRPRSSLNESCFYPGETTYGGASARISLPVDQPKARVVNVTASPSLQRDTIGTSALRILKALEQFSTPVLDAKKIPVRTESNNPRKRKPPQPYEELIFPSMPELLSLKRREVVNKPFACTEIQLQPTPPMSIDPSSNTIVVFPSSIIVSSATTDVSKPIVSASASNTEYSLRPDSTKETLTGSIKGRQKDEDFETERVPELNLPNVQLKLTSLPKFDLGASSQEVNTVPPKSKPESIAISSCSPEFKFSEPEILDKVSSEKIIPNFHVSNFKFSEPLASLELNKKKPQSPLPQSQHPVSENIKEISPVLKMKESSPNFKLKRKPIKSPIKSTTLQNFELAMPSEMKTGSILDVFSKNSTTLDNKLKPLDNNLKCKKCLANYDKNKGKCPCENSKESIKKSDIKTSETKWECKKCHLKNDNSEIKCKHCSSEKGWEPPKVTPKGFEGYKKPTDTWECKECFVRNKNLSDTCVSCSTPKNGKSNTVNAQITTSTFTFSSSGNKSDTVTKTTPIVPLINSIKKPQGSWECDTCLVQNKAETTSCAACSTPKPGSAPVEKPKSTFSFGIPTTETNSFQFGINANTQKNDTVNEKPGLFSFSGSNDEKKSSGFKFGTDQNNDQGPKTNVVFTPLTNSFKKSDKWECSTCLVQNKNDINSCAACNAPKPGSNAVEKPKPPTFSFGVTNTNLSSVNSVQFGSNANTQKTETTIAQPMFTFGSQPDEKKNTNSSNLFKFGTSEAKSKSEIKPTFSFMNSEKPKENELPKPAVSNLFSFGTNAKENKLDETNANEDNPPKKKSSFGKPLISEKHIGNDTNSTIFGNVMSKTNDIDTTNFTFTPKSPFENNSTQSKEPTKEPAVNTFTFGNADSNANLKPPISEPTKPIGFNATTETNAIANNEHPNAHSIFGSTFTGFKPPESENKPFPFMGNSQGNQGPFSFNAVASAPAEPFGSQQPNSGLPLFGQQQQTPAPSLFSQQPVVFGAPAQQQQSVFTFTAAPQQATGIGGSTPAFGGFAPLSNPAPVFNPNVKPSFNFTGGTTPSFSAAAAPNSTGEGPEKRKLRKAIRRTTQHR